MKVLVGGEMSTGIPGAPLQWLSRKKETGGMPPVSSWIRPF